MEQRSLKETTKKIKFCSFSPGRAIESETSTKWLSGSNFLQDNVVSGSTTEAFCVPDSDLLIRSGDIIIKRIAPTFVNFIDSIQDETYAGNNLIIVTPKEGIYPKYLAMVLNENILSISEESSIGAVIRSVSRKNLEALKISLLPYEKQQVIGDLWFDGIELKKLKMRLTELENTEHNNRLKRYIKTFGGR